MESAQKLELTEVQALPDPSIEHPPTAADVPEVQQEHGDTADASQRKVVPDIGPNSARALGVDAAIPSGPPSVHAGTVDGQLTVSEADMPRDPRKRHRAQMPEKPLPSAERLAVASSNTQPNASYGSTVQPQLELHQQALQQALPQAQPQPQATPQLQQTVQPAFSGQGAGASSETDVPKQELQTSAEQPEAIGVVSVSMLGRANGTTGSAAGAVAQIEHLGSNPESDGATLPPPPPLPLPPPLPPHLASSRATLHASTSGGSPLAGQDDACGRSSYVMVGLRESNTAAGAAQAEPAGACGSGGSGGDREHNRERDREHHRQDVERTRERADRDREKDRSRHQPEADGKGGSGRGAAEGRASSPSRRDKDRDGGQGDKTAVRSRSRSHDRAVKPTGDTDAVKDKDRHREKDTARSETDNERLRQKERDKEKQREREKERAREREKDGKDRARGGDAVTGRLPECNVTNGQRNAVNGRSGSDHHKGSVGREKASGRSRSRSRDAKRLRAEDAKPAIDAKEASAPSGPADGSAAARGGGSNPSRRDSGSSATPSARGPGGVSRGGAADKQAPATSVAAHKDSAIEEVRDAERTQEGAVAENIPGTGSGGIDKNQPGPSAPAASAEDNSVLGAGAADGSALSVGALGSSRAKREPIVWNPPALPGAPSPKGHKPLSGSAAEPGGSNSGGQVEQLVETARAPLSPSPRRTYSSSDSEPTRSRSRGYSSSDEDDDAGSIGKHDGHAAGGNAGAAGGVGEGEFDNAENEHEEVLLEYDFDLMEADLMDEHLDEHVRTQDDVAAALTAAADGGAADQDMATGDPMAAKNVGTDGGKAETKEAATSGRFRNGTTGRVAYEDMGAPGPDLSREQQVAHVTAGLVGQVGEEVLMKLRKLLNDMSALDLSTVRPWAFRSLLAINDDEARWRAAQALLSIEWSTANNPGGVLHSRLQRAVEMERMALLRSGRAARAKRARSTSPGGAGPVAKRVERPNDTKPVRTASAEGKRRRSRSRERNRGGSSNDRGRSREPRETRDGGSRPKSRDADEERRRDRHRAASKDRGARDRERDRDSRDAGLLRTSLREPDVKSRRWDDVMRATMRGCIVKLPRAFVEDARRVLYDIDGLDCSQIDANAWDPLLMLPNCEQRLNALRTLRNIRWKERFNVSATVKGTLLRCAEQVQRDMQRRDMMRPGMPLMPLGPLGLIPPGGGGVGGVGALPVRRDARYGPPLGAPPAPPSLLGSRVLPPPPPLTGGSALGIPATRYPPGPEQTRLASMPSRVRDRDRERDDRSKQRGGASGAAGSRGRSRSKSRSPSRGRRGARRSSSKTRSPTKGRSKARSKSRGRSRSPRQASHSKSRSRSRGRRDDARRASSSRSGASSKSHSPADRRGTKRSRSPSQAPADGGGTEEAGTAGASGVVSRPLSSEFKDRMYKYLKSFGKLDLSGVDDKVFECLGRLPDDSARMDCLRRLSGVQWHAVSGAQETQKRLHALLERGTNELLKGHTAPTKKGYTGGSKRRGAGGGVGRR
ncbi:hypothetical protein Vretimale_19428 [Volvox reticuliferus]|nr:hypothetical protein Vretimale_19428 [Volvox reticuliferus]